MKLIGTYFSPFTRRVAAALIALGIPYEHDDLNGYTDPARARQLNPVGKVPVLVLDSGEHLIDSAVILDYLDELVGATGARN
jgi:glutathione S-transferase